LKNGEKAAQLVILNTKRRHNDEFPESSFWLNNPRLGRREARSPGKKNWHRYNQPQAKPLLSLSPKTRNGAA
jgi:hypothetical protein